MSEQTERETADLRTELERTKSGARELGRILDRTLRDALDASGRHDLINEDGDGDWGAVWETLAEMRPTIEGLQEHVRTQTHFVQQWKARAESAEARVRELEAENAALRGES